MTGLRWMILALAPLFAVMPLGAVALSSFSRCGHWTFGNHAELIGSAVICEPAILAAHSHFPKVDRWVAGLVVLPSTVPGIVMALGLSRICAGNYGPVLTRSSWLSIWGYIPVGVPLYDVPMNSSLNGMAVQTLR